MAASAACPSPSTRRSAAQQVPASPTKATAQSVQSGTPSSSERSPYVKASRAGPNIDQPRKTKKTSVPSEASSFSSPSAAAGSMPSTMSMRISPCRATTGAMPKNTMTSSPKPTTS